KVENSDEEGGRRSNRTRQRNKASLSIFTIILQDIHSLYRGCRMKMKSLPTLLLGCLTLSLANPIVVTYPKDTPPSVLEDAMESVISAGGYITHKFRKCP
ncbi:hypothetical protein ABOM_009392, partial [Aspergillus bombycis]